MTAFGADLAAHGPSRRAFEWWKVHQPALAGLEGFDALVAEVRDPATPLEREDARIGALVELAKVDNEAMVALLIVLLPRLRYRVRRYGIGLGADEAEAEMAAALIGQARRYDLGRRPRCVALKLVGAATRKLRQARDRNNTWRAMTVAFGATDTAATTTDAHDGLDVRADTLLAMAVRDGIVTPTDAALITATSLRGLPMRDAAALLGLGYEAARKRRQRSLAILRWYLDDPDRAHP